MVKQKYKYGGKNTILFLNLQLQLTKQSHDHSFLQFGDMATNTHKIKIHIQFQLNKHI